MVKNATSLGRSGLQDWLIQRISSLVITAYVLCIVAIFIRHGGHINFATWQLIFSNSIMRVFTIFFLISLGLHAWIGIWTVTTDYIKCAYLRVTIQLTVIFTLAACSLWGIQILWSS